MEHFTKVTEAALYRLLKSHWGYDSFRYPQKEVIFSIIKGRKTLAIMPTGSGKSLCYQILSLVSQGMIIVVTPLIALMDDQVKEAKSKSISAACLHSAMCQDEQTNVIKSIKENEVQLLFVSPERLLIKSFLQLVSLTDISMIVVDEAHCISQWGYDFRPSYIKIKSFISQQKNIAVLALTATAPHHVQRDIRHQLSIKKSNVFSSSLWRQNLQILVQHSTNKKEVLLDLLASKQCGIIYIRHRKFVELLCQYLNANGIQALAYHAGLTNAVRQENQDRWMRNEVSCMVSTNAFGMGINKADVRSVIHYKPPDSVEDYIQEIGRAGRDGKESTCILLYNHKDLTELSVKRSEMAAVSLSAHKRAKKKSLIRMQGLIKRGMCRYRYLLDYFDEDMDEDCGQCDSCLNRIDKAKQQRKHQVDYFSGAILIDHYLNDFHVKDHEAVLKALNNLIDDGKMKLKGAYLEWNKPF